MVQRNISLIYKNIWIYRLIMNFLYMGRYSKRFKDVINYINLEEGGTVVELCFGDIYIAKYCHENKINWVGYDFNQSFIQNAKQNNFDAHYVDLLDSSSFFTDFHSINKVDMVIMMGSLYHFHNEIKPLIHKIMTYCDKFLISEPISSFSRILGPIGWLAKRSANIGHGNETFRYDEKTLLGELGKICKDRYKLTTLEIKGDLICRIEWK
jgi:hypothetical protein